MAAISTVSSSSRRRLDRPLHAELTQEVGHERPPDLALLFERHSLGHVLCLLRFGAPLRSLLG